jgi:hypothetical protein
VKSEDERRGYFEGDSSPLRHRDHPRPVTRRQFLAQGFVTGAAMVIGPSLLGFFGRSREALAQAMECGIGVAGGGKIPFLCFDLAGGAAVAGGNVLVGGPAGQLDPLDPSGYVKLGIPVGQLPTDPAQVNTELGLAFHADSAFLRGILSKTSATTRASVSGAVFCARSNNDTDTNPLNPMYGINKAGADGDLLTLVGTQSSESGGNSIAPASMVDPTVRPTKVARPEDATGLVDTGKLISLLDQQDATSVMRAAEEISAVRVDKMSEDAMVESLIRCAYTETTDLVSRFGDPGALDPRLDAEITGAATSIFTAAELNQGDFLKTASVMKLVVNGFAGAGTVELGGYDYHDSTRATGERKDFTAGQAMGAALEYAARVGVPLVVYVFSDGSLSSNGQIDNSTDGRGKPVWTGDSSDTAASFMLVYDPAGPPPLSAAGPQIGWFRPGGSVETSATRIADNVNLLTQAVVLNYLALHGEEGRLDMVLPGHGLGAGAERDALTAFSALPAFLT